MAAPHEQGAAATGATGPPDAAGGGPGRRVLARLLDAVVVGLPASAVVALLGLPAPTIGMGGTEVWTRSAATALLWLAYHVVAEAGFGTTVGKRLVGLHVVDAAQGDAPGVVPASLRNGWLLLGLLPLVGGPALLVALVVLPVTIGRDERRRGLHDRLAGTTVVHRTS